MRPLPLTIRPITTWEDALEVRKIRNALAKFMTRDQTSRTVAQQREWWARFQKSRSCTLYIMENDKDVIGYGLTRHETSSQWGGDHHRAWLTGAIKVPYQGTGKGELIFTFLISEAYSADHIPWLEVFHTNGKAQQLYKKLGFKQVSETDLAIIMKHSK